MTYDEAVTLRSTLEANLLSGAGIGSVTIGDRTITYASAADARNLLNRLNRDISAYERRQSNVNPSISTARWR